MQAACIFSMFVESKDEITLKLNGTSPSNGTSRYCQIVLVLDGNFNVNSYLLCIVFKLKFSNFCTLYCFSHSFFVCFSYESMKSLCDRFNRAIDSMLQMVSIRYFSLVLADV